MTNDNLREYGAEGAHNGPPDPDIALITEYLANELPRGEAEWVERRLVEDEAFFEKVWPVVRTWRLPLSFREMLEQQHAEAPDAGSPDAQVEVTTVESAEDELPPPVALRERRLRLHAAEEGALPEPVYEDDVTVERRQRRKRFWSRFRDKTNLGLAGVAAIIAAVMVPKLLVSRPEPPPNDPVVVVLERAPIAHLSRGARVEAGAAESKEILLRGGSRVLLRPGSRLTYQYVDPREPSGVIAALDGEAAFSLTRADRSVALLTSASNVLLTEGSYAVRCAPGCGAMLLTVGTGVAVLRGDTTTTGTVLRAGEKGRVPKGGAPEKVIPGDGWPALPPARP